MSEGRKHTLLKSAAGALCVFAALVVCLMALSLVLYPKDNAPENGMVDFEAFGILGEPADTIDVIVMGDSESFTSISPLQMYNDQGFTSYVCGTKKQLLPYSDTILRRATENQHPRIVLIETNMIYTDIPISELVKRVGKNLFPVVEYHDRWRQLSLSDFTTVPQTTWSDPLKGFQANKNVIPGHGRGHGHMQPSEASAQISRLNEWFLQDMIDYCYSIGATPVLVSAPSQKNWNMERHNGIAQLAERMGVTYVDFNMEPYAIDVDWETESRDGGDHLNYSGAVKFSRALGTWLAETYQLPDHRNDAAYASWDEAYESYCETVERLKPGDSAEHN